MNITLLAFAFCRQHTPAPTVPVLSFTVVDLTAIIRDFGEAKYDAAASSQSTSTPQLRDHPLPLPFYLPFSPSEFRISLAFLNNARSGFQQRLYCPMSCQLHHCVLALQQPYTNSYVCMICAFGCGGVSEYSTTQYPVYTIYPVVHRTAESKPS